MASKIRTEVNASICAGIHDRMSPLQRTELLRLLEERDNDGTTLFNRLKKPAKGPSWSHFKNLTEHMKWLDGLGDSAVRMDGVAARKITDFAGEADVGDAPALRDYTPVKRLALIACLVHKARMRVRDDLATMFCKRVATKIKKAKREQTGGPVRPLRHHHLRQGHQHGPVRGGPAHPRRLTKGADLDALDAALGLLRAAGWPAPEDGAETFSCRAAARARPALARPASAATRPAAPAPTRAARGGTSSTTPPPATACHPAPYPPIRVQETERRSSDPCSDTPRTPLSRAQAGRNCPLRSCGFRTRWPSTSRGLRRDSRR
ncbi:hypothetical protein [Streptomyces sp. KS 21]|uniref:hypothetical protein n=1 Tax=Streptomyces sp. KS 21 TaxID=2485150 RepID=UPI001062C2DC|nr:hypothetical protein [Streptomyces sp. KS 21]